LEHLINGSEQVMLNFDPRAYMFHHDVGQIESLYHTNRDSLNVQIADEEAKIEQFAANPPARSEEEIEIGLPTAKEFAEWRLRANHDSLQIINQTFLLAVYHLWERSLIQWSGKDFKEPKKRYEWLASNGIDFDHEKMEDLREVTRVIKHEQAEKAFGRRPDLFLENTPDHEHLWLSDEDMAAFFQVIRSAGFRSQLPPTRV
jgi:hypothetical protein